MSSAFTRHLIGLALSIAVSVPAAAADWRLPSVGRAGDISISKRTLLDLYVTSRVASAALAKYPDMVLVDVRPASVIAAAGAPSVAAISIPLMVPAPASNVPDAPRQQVDPQFVEKFQAALLARRLGPQATVLVICVSGIQSAKAADLLAEAGHDNVYVIVDGFDGDDEAERSLGGKGWRNEGLAVTPPRTPAAPLMRP